MMENRNEQNVWTRTGFIFLGIASVCYLISATGLLWLYVTGYPLDAMIPQPLAAAHYCVFLYGFFGIILAFAPARRPPGGGSRRKLPQGGGASNRTAST